MNTAKKLHRFLAGVLTVTLALILGAGVAVIPAYAASGNVYTCQVVPCYQHPVTGVIEDSGGEASYATGQGMVEGAVYGTGIMEVTSDGKYYLTIRMSLMDFTSNHSFWVQNVGDSGWSTPAMGVTGSGSDSNGTTTDICIQVPSENCVVRGGMYVEPMGRDVIFYLYPTGYTAGNSTDMNSTMITEEASGGNTASSSGTTGSGTTETTEETVEETAEEAESENSTLTSETDTSKSEETTEEDTEETAVELESSITEAADPVADVEVDSTLDGSQGLSLSTAEEVADEETTESAASGTSAVSVFIAILVAGLILIGVAAGVVYYFRKNWRRIGGEEDDDE